MVLGTRKRRRSNDGITGAAKKAVKQRRVRKSGGRYCAHKDCPKRPSYGTVGGRAEFCKKHAKTGMEDVRHRKCAHKDCRKRPSYGTVGGRAEFCKKHAKTGMEDVANRKCAHKHCRKQPTYGTVGGRAEFCKKHAKTGMEDVVNRKCAHKHCTKQPTYGTVGGRAEFCQEHADTGMVDVVSRKCAHKDCTKHPTYGTVGGRAEFCKEHAKTGMEDVVHRMCAHKDCTTRPSYGTVGGRAEFCEEHAETGMVDVVHPMCAHKDCTTRPSYGTVGGRAEFCEEHAETGMVDVANPMCQHAGCDLHAHNGVPGIPPTCCALHRSKGMIRSPTQRCSDPKCQEIGTHVFCRKRYCEDHQPEGAFNLVLRPCVSCGLDWMLNKEGYCPYCDPATAARMMMSQEEQVVNFLLRDPGLAAKVVSTDLMIDGGKCGKERPDLLLDADTHMVVGECDEHQHRSYPCECEQIRMVNITTSLGVRTIFVRFNPDKYVPLAGQQEVELAERLEKLREWMVYLAKEDTGSNHGMCRVLYLFFDGYDPQNPDWQTIPIL
ncbi:unnamed protein product [Pedinophyceae sp. YPF-701]|nr:unnamed protein product [Pedinophyceae sp. YPF-701]